MSGRLVSMGICCIIYKKLHGYYNNNKGNYDAYIHTYIVWYTYKMSKFFTF